MMRGALLFSLVLLSTPAWAQAPAADVAPAPTDGGPPATVEADPDAPTVGASLDRTEAFIGDKLTLTVSAVARAGIVVNLPAKLDLGKLELLSREGEDKPRDLGDGRRSYRVLLGVAAYETGDLEIPSLSLTYLTAKGDVRTVRTSPVSVHIRSLVPRDDQGKAPEVQPERPPRSALVEDKRVMRVVRIAGVVVGGALLLLVLWLLIRRALRRRVDEVQVLAPVRPPDETAIERLRAIKAAGSYAVDGYRPFYFAVAEVVRGYLGARYGFDSLELTTTELLDELSVHAPHLRTAADGRETEVVRFLSDTDMVKFANTGSTDRAAEATIDAAMAIVLSTAKPLEAATAQLTSPVLQPKPLDDPRDARKP